MQETNYFTVENLKIKIVDVFIWQSDAFFSPK